MAKAINEKILEYIWEHSMMCCLQLTRQGIIVKANAFASGLVSHALPGKPFQSILLEFGNPLDLEKAVSDNSQTFPLNITTKNSLPETFYFRFYDLGENILAVGEANNEEITLLRKNLLEINQELHNLGRELQKKNADLKKLNDQKNKFLGIAAHDLRNPLAIIMGYGEFLIDDLQEKLSPDQRTMLMTIRHTSEFMLQLLNELLDISRIESGNLNIAPEKTDFVALVRENTELNRVIAGKKDISIQLEIMEDIPEIMLDPLKITQVLHNLVGNAIKYSFPGTKICIRVFRSGQYLTVAVEDQGQGIAPEDLERLFKPFESIRKKGTSGEKSTGLGLAIVRNIIFGHQGKIWVESQLGKGSAFYFALPFSGNIP
jgi:signal transduction histidine kinase